MNVLLNPASEQIVTEKLRSGLYEDPGAVIEDALRLLKQRDEQKLGALRKDLQHAAEQLESGEFTEYDEQSIQDLFDEVSAEGRQRLAAERDDAH
jgi:putative addiction module CopG family antidote